MFLGFNLTGFNAVQVRQGNRMALKSIKRCQELDEEGKFFSLEHPWRSWLWYLKQSKWRSSAIAALGVAGKSGQLS